MRFYKLNLGIMGKLKMIFFKIKWSKVNNHNKCYPIKKIPLDIVKIGMMSYGPVEINYFGNIDERLEIGNFVSIAEGVKFILGGNHETDTFTTYPFKVMLFGEKLESKTKGPVIVKDDVWIGTNALILSGVTIGQGSIVAAGSVVTKDIPPYAIVGGNPAKIIRYKYSQDIIDEMMKVDWKKIDLKKLENIKNELYEKLDSDTLKKILKGIE